MQQDILLDSEIFSVYKDLMEEKFEASIKRYLEDAKLAISNVRKGVDSKDFETVAMFAHKLKSPSRSIGAFRLATHCENIEKGAYDKQPISADTLAQLEDVFDQTSTEILTHLW